MAIKEETKSRVGRVVSAINESDMDDLTKAYLTEINARAAEGTNGLTPEQKLQNVSETVSALAELDTYGFIDRHNAAKRDKEIQKNLEDLGNKIESIDKRLSNNDKKTDEVSQYIEKADKLIESFKNIPVASVQAPVVQENKGKFDLIVDLLKKIGWPGCVTIAGIFGIVAFRPEIVSFISKIYSLF